MIVYAQGMIRALMMRYVAVLGCLVLAMTPDICSAQQEMAVATHVRLDGDGQRTRLEMTFSRTVDLRAFTLSDPYRVVIDLPQAEFRFPPETGKAGRGLVRSFRYGLVMQGGSRIIADLSAPASIERAVVTEEGGQVLLRLDLALTDRESFMKSVSARATAASAVATTPAPAVKPVAPAKGDGRPLVVIDAGHGGIDSGASPANGEPEKHVVLAFARALRERLNRTGRIRTLMTRDSDVFLPLAERVQIARRNEAALFVSIHADALAHRDGVASGATVYTLSEKASDLEAEKLAEHENRADAIAGMDLTTQEDAVADILIDLVQRETNALSAQIAKALVPRLVSVTRMHRTPHRSAGFMVLKAPDVPSVLIELGFISTPQDYQMMTSAPWRERTTGAMSEAIEDFLARRQSAIPATASGARAN